jgi:hypothetical protein
VIEGAPGRLTGEWLRLLSTMAAAPRRRRTTGVQLCGSLAFEVDSVDLDYQAGARLGLHCVHGKLHVSGPTSTGILNNWSVVHESVNLTGMHQLNAYDETVTWMDREGRTCPISGSPTVKVWTQSRCGR